jgi:hypothetical protein
MFDFYLVENYITVIRLVSSSAKFGTSTVLGLKVQLTIIKAKLRTFKSPTGAKFSTSCDETVYI